MPCRRCHRRTPQTILQFDLFGPPNLLHPDAPPAWQQLPETVRATVMQLMARLLVEHASDHLRPRSIGGSDDL